MKKKVKQTAESVQDTNMTGTSTSSTNTPSWVSDLAGGFAGAIPGVKTVVAGPSALQQTAMDSLSGMDFGGLFGDAAGMVRKAATKLDEFDPSALGGVKSWLNPFLGGVVDATAADLDVNDARTRTMQALDQAKSKSFGGSGAALTRAFTEGELERARAKELGGLRMGAFDSAASNAQQDKARELASLVATSSAGQSGASTLASLGATGLGLQADLGATQRDIANQQGNSSVADLITQMGLFGDLTPIIELLSTRTNTTSGTTNQTGRSTSTTTTSDPMGQLSQLLQGLGALTQGAGAISGGART